MRVGADSGGTFTDVVTDDGRLIKLPSTPDDPGAAVRSGMAQAVGAVSETESARATEPGVDLLSHGTTVATNALLERRLARVALVTTRGFSDVIEIARQDRPHLYDPWVDRPEPLVGRDLRFEVNERIGAGGEVLVPYRSGSAPEIPVGVDVVALCCLHADLNPAHEQSIAEDLRARGLAVVASHEVVGACREYERMVTTVINAALRPLCADYLSGLSDAANEVAVMTSAGGLVGLERASAVPVSLLLSGPAAGARASAAIASACGYPDSLSFDMGGTSTDVCLALGGEPMVAAQQEVSGFPIRLPALAIHTVGAGGGSIASIDEGGALLVGPRSAGAVPGPVCYRRGGAEPTVTDANLVAGRIPSGTAFSGLGELDVDAASAALERVGATAGGVIDVVNTTMVQALRKVSVEQGVDPAGLALVAFGGAGPLHACELAAELGVAVVIVPAAAGVLSALGLLSAPPQIELVRSWPAPADHSGLAAAAVDLAEAARAELGGESGEVVVANLFDCRYAGQSHEIRVHDPGAFHEEHERVNGYARRGDVVEVTAIRAVATAEAPATVEELSAPWAEQWKGVNPVGPTVVSREDCTIWIPSGWAGSAGPHGSLILEHR